MSSNPYQSPAAASHAARSLASRERSDSARTVFLAWEWLRLGYNAVLALVVVVFAGSSLAEFDFWEFLALGAFVANICFCLGPVMEGYLSLVGIPRRAVRWLIFVPGVLFACVLAVGALYNWRAFISNM